MSQSGASSRPYQDPLETWTEKFSRKFKENPWVPIGCVATCGALIMAAVKLRTGKSKQMNYWLRARVGLQGATVVALLMGSTWGQEWVKDNFGKEDSIAAVEEIDLSKELKREKERMEFEERLREAQAATEEEEMLRTRTDNGFTTDQARLRKERGKWQKL
ncbi:hypoxia induced protein conserved region-domain-containing protein [Gymnopilus junonius]|uniref:Hypoxia induced protein conserved region-domain-containing protein n=1 Tax=Gymnopilus junonius TaxID=109634 RepID=A0A9P5NRK0_GYMJU|nr:hypoxia induced protein conserved region-domain-containing protein [Gymnopilus junonius]